MRDASQNLCSAFLGAFPSDGATPLMTLPSGRVVTYAEIDALSALIAGALITSNCASGDRLMMQVEKTPEAIAVYLGCLRAGVIFIPLNTAYGRDELEYLVGDAEPAAIVADPASPLAAADFPLPDCCAQFTLDGEGKGSLLDGAAGPAQTMEMSGGQDIAAILYTSGTTGKPKGAMLSHSNLLTNAASLVECWGMTAADVLLHALPIFHTHGLFVAVNTTLLSGARMQFLPRFDLDETFNALERSTMMMGVPTFYTRMLGDARLDRPLCNRIRLFISGSAPLLPDTFAAFQNRTGHAILERYGMTETNMIASNPLEGDRRRGSVGRALPGVSVRIAGDGGGILEAGEIGGIEVAGPNVFSGYWKNPEKTQAEFCPDGYFKTGDVGYLDHDGYLSIVGRSKDLIISGGFNVYPKEVEEVIDAIAEVSESAVVGVPHKDFGEGVVAIVVCKGNKLNADAVRRHCRERLAAYKSPKAVALVEALPRNAMGKVEKAKLRDTYAHLFSDP